MSDTIIQLRYNPYENDQRLSILYQNGMSLEELSPTSSVKRYEGNVTLQHHLKGILEGLYHDYCSGKNSCTVYFCGTKADYDDFIHEAKKYDSIRVIHDKKLKDVTKVKDRISGCYQSLKDSLADREVRSVNEALQKYNEAEKQTFVLCVVGTYSSGKSAFINALIGDEVLPSSVNTLTNAIYRVHQLESGKRPALAFMDQTVSITEDYHYQIENEEAENAASVNRKLRSLESEEPKRKVTAAYRIYCLIQALSEWEEEVTDQLTGDPIKRKKPIADKFDVYIPFQNSTLPQEYSFVILDTPGTDSLYEDKLQEKLRGAMRDLTNGMPIILTENTKTNSTVALDLLDKVREGTALDYGNRLLIINKADEMAPSVMRQLTQDDSSPGSGSKSKLIQSMDNRILFTSAIVGLGAKKGDGEISTQAEDWSDDSYRELFDKYRESVQKYPLYEYAKLSEDRLSSRIMRAKAFAEEGDRQKLLACSGILTVEDEICSFAERYAWYNKCRQMKEFLEAAIRAADDDVGYTEKQISESSDKAKGKLSEDKQTLIEKLDKLMEDKETTFNTDFDHLVSNIDTKFRDSKVKYGHARKESKRFHYDERLQACWKAGRKDPERKANVEKKAKEYAKKDFDDWSDSISDSAKKFWSKAQDEVKDDCGKLITESKGLTEEQKAKLKEALNAPPIVTPEISLDFDSAFRKFLWWDKFDKVTASKEVAETVTNHMDAAKETYVTENNKEFARWKNKLRETLQEEMVSWNTNLRELQAEIDRLNKEKEKLIAVRSSLQQGLKEMNSLTGFTDEALTEEEGN